MNKEIAEYSRTEAALATLREKYAGAVFDVTTKTGMTAAKAARKDVRDYRLALEKTRVKVKADALSYCKLVDNEATRIRLALEALENPLAEQIAEEENRRERERAEAVEAARARQFEQERRIGSIRELPLRYLGGSSQEIQTGLDFLAAETLEDIDEPRMPQAMATRDTAVTQLRAMLSVAVATEQAEAALQAHRDELAAEQSRIEAEQAEHERVRVEREKESEAERVRLDDVAHVIMVLREAHLRVGGTVRDIDAALSSLEAVAVPDYFTHAEAEQMQDARTAATVRLRAIRVDVAAHEAERLAIERNRREAELQEQQRLDKELEDAIRARLAKDAEAAERLAKYEMDEIATATLRDAATDALQLLTDQGLAEHLITRRLSAALVREPDPMLLRKDAA